MQDYAKMLVIIRCSLATVLDSLAKPTVEDSSDDVLQTGKG